MSAVAPDVATVMAAAAQAAAFQPRKLTPKDRNMYHLKRIMSEVKYPKDQEQRLFNLFKQTKQCTISEAEIRTAYALSKELLISQGTIVLLDRQTRFGRNPEMVDIVLHSDTSGNQMVSRLHAEIHAEVDPKDPAKFLRYYIVDKSLNGTYVNNQRAPVESSKLYLNAGDVIRFGHSNGAAFKPGEYAQTYDSEFSFVFEPAMEDVEYLGHTPDGNRIERKGPKAYMHIGSTSILPHEFDHFSLVPKREPDLSIVPLGMRGNKEQKTAQLYQARTQLVMERGQDDSPILPANNFSAANIQIPGLTTPAVIPTMSNFDLTSDMSRLFRELQNQNGQTADQINAALLQALIQQQNLSSFYYQPPNPLLTNLNALLNQQRLPQQLYNPPSNVDFLAALKSLSTPVLTSQGNFLPEFNNGIGGINAAMAAVTSLANSAALQQMKRDDLMSAIRAHQDGSAGPSSSTPASTTSDHNDEVIIAQKKAQAEAEARRSEAQIAAVLKGGCVSNLHPEDRELIMNQATLLRNNEMDAMKKKVDINEFTLKAIAEAAEAAATSGKTNFSPPLKSPTVLPKKERKKKVVDGSVPGTSMIRDHVQETIDAVAKRVLECGSGEKEDAEEAEAIIRQQMEIAENKQRKRRVNKKSLENNGESGKSKETVLKLLDDAKAEMEPLPSKLEEEAPTTSPQVEQIELPEPQPSTTRIEPEVPVAVPIIVTKEPDDEREETSSVGSLIVCEASLDDPALLNPSSINDGNIFETKPEMKPESLERRSSTGSKTGLLKRRKESTSSSDSDSDFDERIKKAPIKKQTSLTEKRGKKSTSSVKHRVIRVPRSPIPNKKGPERIPGHKSNEVARLLYDLEVLPISGSYMQCQRIGDEKETRRRNRDSSDDDQPPAILPKRKSADGTRILSIDGRISESPAKRLKDGFVEDINGNISSSDSDDSIKMNGNLKPKKKAEKVDKKPKPRKQAEKRKASSSDDSSDSETEPTPRKRKSATMKTKKEDKKPAKTAKKVVETGKKKRGRKAKNSGDGSVEWEKCAFAGCKHPRVEGTVNWVQCDDCDKWFHIFCAFGREDKSVLEDEFHCGCKRVRSSANPTNTTAVTA